MFFRYNEARRLSERYLEFDVSELKRTVAKAVSKRPEDIQSLRKLAEGGFNRTFEITTKDGMEIIARLPYPSTLPKRYAVASEVATMDLVRSYGVPVPRIYDYSISNDNPVGSEYIIMEKVSGKEIGHSWYDLSIKDKKSITIDVAELEAILFSIQLPAHGSIYYRRDLTPSDRGIDIPDREGFCVGPIASLGWWYDRRDLISISRGPCKLSLQLIAFMLFAILTCESQKTVSRAEQLMEAGARKELAWVQRYGTSRWPFDRHHREILDYRKSSPDEHIEDLERYLKIAPHLVPEKSSLLKPTIRHPDLQPHNIFVSDDSKILGLIDWQHCSVLPLFLHVGVPKYWQNTSDDEGAVVVEDPTLPPDYEQLSAEEQAKAMQDYRQRQLYLLYLAATNRFNSSHLDAYLTRGIAFKRRIFEHASAPWEGDNTTLKADLILAMQNWDGLTAKPESSVPVPACCCPISFTEQEVNETLRVDLLLKEVDIDMENVRDGIGIGSDGWVPMEDYESAVEKNNYIRQQVDDECAENERDRELSLLHYPFVDHDEEE